MKRNIGAQVSYMFIWLIGMAVLAEMGFFLLYQWFGFRWKWDLFQFCLSAFQTNSWEHQTAILLIDAIIAYTFSRLLWRFIKQIMLTRKWNAYFASAGHPEWTRLLSERYRYWNIPIRVVRDPSWIAMAMGWFRPRIVVSTQVLEWLPEEEIEAVLLHELHHCRNRDPLKLFLAGAFQESMPFIPVFKGLLRHYKIWSELQADRYSISQLGSSYELGQVLLKLSNRTLFKPGMAGTAFAGTAVDYRIQQIIDPSGKIDIPIFSLKSTTLSLMILFFIISMLLGGCA